MNNTTLSTIDTNSFTMYRSQQHSVKRLTQSKDDNELELKYLMQYECLKDRLTD